MRLFVFLIILFIALPDSARAQTSSMIYTDGAGNYGIGTTSPRAQLDIDGSGTVEVHSNNNAMVSLFGNGQASSGLWLYVGNSQVDGEVNSAGSLRFGMDGLNWGGQNISFAAFGSELMRIMQNGNVGINSSAPQARLDVEGSAYFGNGNVGIGTTPVDGIDLMVKTYIQTAGWGGLRFGSGGSAGIYGQGYGGTDDYIAIYTSSLTRVFIDDGGNVGINTEAPQARLDVAGNIYVGDGGVAGSGNVGIGTASPANPLEINLNTANNYLAYFYNTGGSTNNSARILLGVNGPTSWDPGIVYYISSEGYWHTGVDNDDDNKFKIGTGSSIIGYGTTVITANTSGNVGIASVSPQARLDVAGNIYVGDGGVAGSGNLGIGSSAPGQKLDVIGTVKATAFIGDGSGLTGVGSQWTTNGADIYYNSGNVGIGSSAPASTLDLREDGAEIRLVSSSEPSAYYTTISQYYNFANSFAIVNSTGNVPITIMEVEGIGASSRTVLGGGEEIQLRIAGNNALTIDSGSNVGIGSSVPRARLEVAGGAYFTAGNVGIGTTSPENALSVGAASDFQVDASGAIAKLGGGDIYMTFGGIIGYNNAMVYDNYNSDPGSGTLLVGGSSASSSLELRSTHGTGTADFIQFTGGDNGATEIVRMTGAGNVGINSSAPQAKLDVQGNVYFGNGNIGVGTTAPASQLEVASSAAETMIAVRDTANDTRVAIESAYGRGWVGTLDYHPLELMTSGSARLRVHTSGNIGIGSSDPAERLDVIGTVKATAFIGDGSGITGLAAAGGWSDGGANVYLTTSTDNVGIGTSVPRRTLDIVNGSISLDTGGGLYWFSGGTTGSRVQGGSAGGDNYVSLYTNNAVRLSVNHAGNVGIGSTVPQAKLDVEGNVYVGNGNVGIGSTLPEARLTIRGSITGSSPAIKVVNTSSGGGDSAYISLVNDTGYFADTGVGSSNQQSPYVNRYFVYASSGISLLAAGATDDIRFFTGGSTEGDEKARLTSAGNLGIGTSVPVQKVEVVGTVKATSFVGDGSGLTGLTSSQWTTNGTMIYYNTGNVGIGTSAPTHKFAVTSPNYLNSIFKSVGDSQISVDAYSGGINARAALVLYSGGTSWMFRANNSTIDGLSIMNTLNINDTGAVLHLTESGNVGINSIAPQAKLDVEGNVYVGNGNIGIGTSASANLLAIAAPESGAAPFLIRNTTASANTFAVDQNGQTTLYATWGNTLNLMGRSAGQTGYYLQANTFAGTPLFTVDSTGNVGLSSSAPQAKLDVEGSAYFGNGNIGVGSSVPSQKVDVLGTVRATAFIGDGSSLTGVSSSVGWTRSAPNVFLSTSSDNVGIGTSVPNARLNLGTALVSAAGSMIGINDPSAAYEVLDVEANGSNRVNLSVNNTPMLTLTQSTGASLMINGGIGGITTNSAANALSLQSNGGNVGINSSAPQAKLDVEGSVYVGNGNVGIGTSVPGAKLDVIGAIAVSGDTVNKQSTLSIGVDGAIAGKIQFGNSVNGLRLFTPGSELVAQFGTNSITYFKDNVGIASTVPQARLDVEGSVYVGNGNVGIGTINPAVNFQINSANTATSPTLIRLMNPNGAANAGAAIDFGYNNSDAYILSKIYSYGDNGYAGQFRIALNAAGSPSTMVDRLVINGTSGNVGIGTSAPQAKLDVEGNVYVGNGNVGIGTSVPGAVIEVNGRMLLQTQSTNTDNTLPGNSTARLTIRNLQSSSNVVSTIDFLEDDGLAVGAIAVQTTSIADPQGRMYFYTRDTVGYRRRMVIDESGNVGIGSNAPLARLELVGSGTTSASAALMIRDSAAAARVTVLGDGNVGVGTSAPAGALEVRGQYYSTQYTTTTALDWNNGGVQYIQLANGEQTFTFANGRGGGRYMLILKQPSSGAAGTVVWPGTVLWPGGSAPVLTGTNSKTDVITFVYDSANSVYYAGSSLNY